MCPPAHCPAAVAGDLKATGPRRSPSSRGRTAPSSFRRPARSTEPSVLAIVSLGELGDPAAIPALLHGLQLERSGVSFLPESSFALFLIGPPSAEPLLKISMCGEMAGDPANALVLVALGLDTLSMNPADIPPVKRVLRSAQLRDARELLEAAMSFTSVDEIERFVHEQVKKRSRRSWSAVRSAADPLGSRPCIV